MTTIQFKPVTVANRDQNIFLTSSPTVNGFKKGIKSTDDNILLNPDIREVQLLRRNIIQIVVQFKSLPKPIQLSHQFNQILYSLDTHLIEKKTVGNIISSLEAETNVIKLTRLYNRLKGFGKALQRVKVQNESQKTLKKVFSAQGLRNNHHQSSKSHLLLHNVTSQTLPSKQPNYNNQMKQQIITQISYRQRLQKIESQRRRHSLNKQKLMKKKLQRVKQMNKKASEIFQKNKKLYKQRITKHKYQQLFDPNQVKKQVQRRGQMMSNGYYPLQQQLEVESEIYIGDGEEFITQPKSVVRVGNNKELLNSKQSSPRGRGEGIERSIKQKISAMMSLTEITNSGNIKALKSLNNLSNTKHQQLNQKSPSPHNHSKPNKFLNFPIQKSFSLDRTLKAKNLICNSKRQQHKLEMVRQKKRQLQEQKHIKMVTQAVQKEKRIMQIAKNRTLITKTKNSPPEESVSDRSFANTSANYYLFRHATQQKQRIDLEEKQRQILSKLQNKKQKKELFLQERVNRVRERLEQEEETKEKYRQYVNQYVQMTEGVGAFVNGNQLSPIKKQLKKRQQSQQEDIIKCAYRRRMRQSEGRLKEKSLLNLSLTDLKKKLIKIQNEQVRSFNPNFMI